MNASKDANGANSLLAVSSSDGKATVRVQASPDRHALAVSDGASGSDLGPDRAPRDENGVPALLAVSSADGKTPVAVYATVAGNLLIKST